MSERGKENRKEKLKAAASEAYGKLHSNDLVWILDAAIKHFEDSTTGYQNDLVRWERFPPAPPTPGEEGKVARAKRQLERYKAVLDFLEPLKWLIVHVDAETFGEDMRANFFRPKLRSVPTKRKNT